MATITVLIMIEVPDAFEKEEVGAEYHLLREALKPALEVYVGSSRTLPMRKKVLRVRVRQGMRNCLLELKSRGILESNSGNR